MELVITALTGDQLREAIARDLAPRHWSTLLQRHRDRLRRRADEILALPTVAALARGSDLDALADERARHPSSDGCPERPGM